MSESAGEKSPIGERKIKELNLIFLKALLLVYSIEGDNESHLSILKGLREASPLQIKIQSLLLSAGLESGTGL